MILPKQTVPNQAPTVSNFDLMPFALERKGTGYFQVSIGTRKTNVEIDSQATESTQNGAIVDAVWELMGTKDPQVVGFVRRMMAELRTGDVMRLGPSNSTQIAAQNNVFESVPCAKTPIPDGATRGIVTEWESFPTDCLPDPLSTLSREGSKAIGCDEAMIALALLAAVGAAVGNSRRIQLKAGWNEPAVIWTMTLSDSGTGKSPADKLAMKSLRRKENELYKRYQEAKSNYADAIDAWEQSQKNKSNSRIGAATKPVEPVAERLVISDATSEAIAAILQTNIRGLILSMDEAAGWIKGFDQYRAGGKGNDLQRWLSIFDAGPMTVDRKVGDCKHIHIPRTFVCFSGGIQPGIFQQAMTQEHDDSGFTARLLIANPPDNVATWTDATVSKRTEAAVDDLFDGLLALEMQPDEDGNMAPVDVPLDPEALAAWVVYFNRNSAEMSAMTGNLRAVWAKLKAYAARLALLVHLARVVTGDADESAVDLKSIQSGIALADWFGNERRRMEAGGETPEQAARRKLADLIRLEFNGRITPRELQRKKHYEESKQATDQLHTLVAAGLGYWDYEPSSEIGGRPSTQFILNDAPDVTIPPAKLSETRVLSHVTGLKIAGGIL